MDRSARAHLALFTVNFIYGVNYVVAKGLMPHIIAPSGFILLRVIGATVLFWMVRALKPQRVDLADMVRLLLCAVFGVALNQLMFFHGLMRTTPINSSLIMVATPVLVLVLSALLIGERVTWSKVVGVVMGTVGALTLIFLKPEGSSQGASMLGDLFILVNATSYGLYLVLVKPLMRKYSAVTVMSWSFLFGFFMVLPFGWQELAQVNWDMLSGPVLGAFVFVVVMVTFVAYLLNTWALGVLDTSVVGSYIYVQPVLAAVFTWLFVQIGPDRSGIPGEYQVELGWPQVVCAILIFLGVHLVGRRSPARQV